jgi:hypothetical protein
MGKGRSIRPTDDDHHQEGMLLRQHQRVVDRTMGLTANKAEESARSTALP